MWLLNLINWWSVVGMAPEWQLTHYCDVIMGAMASQITSLTIVYSIVHSGADKKKHAGNSPMTREFPAHKWPVTRKMVPFDDVIMGIIQWCYGESHFVVTTLELFCYKIHVILLAARIGVLWLCHFEFWKMVRLQCCWDICQTWTDRAPSQYTKRRLFVRSREVSKPRDWYFKLLYRFEIWQAHRQHCCRSACQISERSDNSKYKSRGFETLRDLTERRLFGYWDGAQVSLQYNVALNVNPPQFMNQAENTSYFCYYFLLSLNKLVWLFCIFLRKETYHFSLFVGEAYLHQYIIVVFFIISAIVEVRGPVLLTWVSNYMH